MKLYFVVSLLIQICNFSMVLVGSRTVTIKIYCNCSNVFFYWKQGALMAVLGVRAPGGIVTNVRAFWDGLKMLSCVAFRGFYLFFTALLGLFSSAIICIRSHRTYLSEKKTVFWNGYLWFKLWVFVHSHSSLTIIRIRKSLSTYKELIIYVGILIKTACNKFKFAIAKLLRNFQFI